MTKTTYKSEPCFVFLSNIDLLFTLRSAVYYELLTPRLQNQLPFSPVETAIANACIPLVRSNMASRKSLEYPISPEGVLDQVGLLHSAPL